MKSRARGRLFFSLLYVLATFALLYALQTFTMRESAIEVPYNDFRNEIRAGHIAEIQVGDLKGMDRVAHALVERETLDRRQLDELLKRAA